MNIIVLNILFKLLLVLILIAMNDTLFLSAILQASLN